MSLSQWAGVIARPVHVERPDSSPPRLRVVLVTASLGLQGLVRLTISVLVGQQAGPSALAQVASALAVASILSLLWPSATGVAASRFVAAAREHTDTAEPRRVTAHLGRRTMQASVLLAPAGAVFWTLRGGDLADSLIVALLTLGLGGYAFVRGVHNGANQLVRLVAWDCVLSLAAMIATAVLLASGSTGVVALGPLAIAYLVITIAGWPWGGKGAPRAASEIDHFVLWSTVGSLASAGLIHITMIVADHRLLGEEAGHFAAALNLVAPAALLANSFSMAFFPQIAAAFARDDPRGAVRMASQATSAMTLVMGATFGGLTIMAPWVITLLWGSAFGPSALVFPVLAIGPLCRAVSMPAVTTISSRNRAGVRRASTSTLTGLAVALVIWVALPGSGWVGVAAGYSAAMTLTALRNVVEAVRRENLPWLAPWSRLLVGAVGVAALCVVRDHFELSFTVTTAVCLLALTVWTALNAPAARSLIRRQGPQL